MVNKIVYGFQILQQDQELSMQAQTQYVISLGRMSVPSNMNLKRITLSISSAQQELFIQNTKNVKDCKIHFYRQCMFLSSLSGQARFNLYQIQDKQTKTLIKQLIPAPSDIASVSVCPTIFKTQNDGFELVWESWLFSDDSQDMNQYTQRDYSELNIPFQNEEQEQLLKQQSNILDDQHHQRPILFASPEMTKRSSSSTNISMRVAQRIKQIHELNIKQAKVKNLILNNNDNLNKNLKQKGKIRNNIYSRLIQGISAIFSQIDSS